MTRDALQVAAEKKEEDLPMEIPESPDNVKPSDSNLRADEEIFAWMQTAASDLMAEGRTSRELL